MKKQRITAAAASLMMLAQTAVTLPALSVSAADSVPLGTFAARVQALTANDSGKTFYDALEFDPASGTLTADGTAKSSVGDLSVRGGRLMVQTGSTGRKTGVQSGSSFSLFADAAEAHGYSYTESDGVLHITNEFQTARLIVKAKGTVPQYGAVSAAEGYNDLHILQYASPAEAFAAYQKYETDAHVAYLQPSHRIQLDDSAEPQLAAAASGSYNTWGAGVIGTEDFTETYLNAEILPEVIVAVIDTGINAAPALFDGRILENGINVSDSGDDSVEDDYGHGTHCTGTICELTPSNVKILPIKTFDLKGGSSDEQIYLGIVYAIEQGADVLNMSFGGLGVSQLEIEALEIAEENNVICCAAAGNNADDAAYYYPGGIASAITVGAVDANMALGNFSNFGRMIDVVAPGVGILSYVAGGADKKESWNGTSMATPHAAACCALLRSYDKEMSPRRAEAILQRNAVDLGEPGFDDTFGWGLVCMRDLQWDDGICMAPEFGAEPGNYGVQVTVELTSETEGASIYYSTDGTDPTPETGTLYTAPLNITETTLLRAIAAKDGYVASVPAEAVYMIGGKDAAHALTVENGVLTRYYGVKRQLTIPESVNGEKITAVAADAFKGNRYTEQVILPESVTSIGDGAFAGCILLKAVSAPGVTEIGARAFAECAALHGITTAKLGSVGKEAFYHCTALTALDLTGVRDLPEALCSGCTALQKVTAPDAVNFGMQAFLDCTELTRLDCDWRKAEDIGVSALAGCEKWEGVLCLDALKHLGEAAFSGDSSLLRVSLPETITELQPFVLNGCANLRLLQLPGVTVISDGALGINNMSADLVTELDYGKITHVGNGAFFGFPIGGESDTVEFTSLTEMESRCFAGVKAGALSFPQIRAIPDDAFAETLVNIVAAEQAESIGKNGLGSVPVAVVSEKLTEVAAGAYRKGIWMVTTDTIPALDENATEYTRCPEPLVIGDLERAVTVVQHAYTPLAVLGCGFGGLRYQWYKVDGETETALDGEVSAVYVPDTSAAGSCQYLCVMTDGGGKTERVSFTLTVKAQETAPEQLPAEGQVYAEQGGSYAVAVTEDGSYTLTASGSTAVTGVLADAAGQPVSFFETDSEGSRMTAALAAGVQYTLTVSPRWDGVFALRREQADSVQPIAACRVTAADDSITGYGTDPAVTVTAPDGTRLTAGKDYELKLTRHNQTLTAAVFGIGSYSGCAVRELTVWQSIPEDTAVPVALHSKQDTAVFAFTPRVSGKYYYYATYGENYGAEQDTYFRTGSYSFSPSYTNLSTRCVVSDLPDGSGAELSSSKNSSYGGSLFGSSLTLSAGQTYYFICTGAPNSGGSANYNLVVTQTQHDIRRAEITDGFCFAFYNEGSSAAPDLTLTDGGTVLTEGKDYVLLLMDRDVPGKTTLMVTGLGRYYGTATKSYELVYSGSKLKGTELTVGETVSVNTADSRVTYMYFRAEAGKTVSEEVRYRILAKKKSGSVLKYSVYAYDDALGTFSLEQPVSDQQLNDFELKNGMYCIAFFSRYGDLTGESDVTVLVPYNLEKAAVTVGDMPYTGADVYPPITVTAEDGTELTAGTDYTVQYPERHTLFGTTRAVIRPTNTSYNSYNDEFEIYVDLPEDAPEITPGAHEAVVTFEDRLAFYRLTAETETTYTLSSTDVADEVLRVFTPDAEMIGQDYGHHPKSVSFTVPAGETRWLLVKFNGTDRCGTVHFRLDTDFRRLQDCEIVSEPVLWTGERVLPQVTFRDGDYVLQEGKDYSLRYTEYDTRIGTANANFVGIGDYFGTCDVEYFIVSPDLLADASLEAMPIALDTPYRSASDLEEEYVVVRYTAGFDDEMLLTVLQSSCKLNVQRYDAEGHFAESVFAQPSGEMGFSLKAGETCYLLFSAQDLSGSNQSFRFSLSDPGCPTFRTVSDTAHGVTYRVFPSLGIAEVYKINSALDAVTLLPEADGVPVTWVTEGLFIFIPQETVVYGYAGCAAADYAAEYGFVYVQLPAEETAEPHDLNGDGACTLADAVLLSHILGEHAGTAAAEWQLTRADVNGDGTLDLRDLRALFTLLQ